MLFNEVKFEEINLFEVFFEGVLFSDVNYDVELVNKVKEHLVQGQIRKGAVFEVKWKEILCSEVL